MSRSPSAAAAPSARPRRFGVTLAAFVIGLPPAVAILCLANAGAFDQTPLHRYLLHPAQQAEIVMFCVALGSLVAKLWQSLPEKAAFRYQMLPAWDGKPVPVSDAASLLSDVERKPRRLLATYLGRRIAGILEFLRDRGSAAELDDHMRALGDGDALVLESSYALTRFITWAIPILGFLGTVLGITAAISNVSPDVLEKSISGVTDGLAEAFDTTALALSLTMIVMFCSFLVERLEEGVLLSVDSYAERYLAHRFERTGAAGAAGGEVAAVVRQNSQALIQATEQLVQKQAAVWAQALEQAEQRRLQAEHKVQDRLTAALESALDKTLDTHCKRLAALEKQSGSQAAALLEKLTILAAAVRESGKEQQAALAKVAEGLGAQTGALTQLQDGERQLLRLQETLQQNLGALAGAGAFEQAVHSLTAAIHLLTLHSGPSAQRRPGLAA
jgi:hypothetical protein